jgi:dUTP pyrophosphatase
MTGHPTIKLFWDHWADETLALPSYETSGAAGADLRVNFPPEVRDEGYELPPMERCIFPTGFRMEIPAGFEAQIRPRSGLAFKHGISVANAPGTIDSDYRGPVGVLLVNLGDQPFRIRHGERIAQMVVAPVVQAAFEVTGSVSESERGDGGFGSTGAR